MPVIQELMGAPSFGGQLGAALGGGLGQGISQGISQQIQNFQKQKQGRAALSGLQPLLKQAGIEFSPEETEQFLSSGINPDTISSLASNIYKQKQAQEAEQQKLHSVEQEKLIKEEQEQNEWKDVFQSLEERLPYVGAPVGKAFLKNIPWSKAAEEREAFDVAAFQLERFARAAHTKGALSKGVYDSLLSKLPSSKLTEAQNRGRMKIWEKVLVKKGMAPKDLENLSEKTLKEENEAELPTATNKKTGQKLIFKEGKWQPLQ